MSRQAKPPSPSDRRRRDLCARQVTTAQRDRTGRCPPSCARRRVRHGQKISRKTLLAGVVVDQRYTLAGTRRGAGTAPGDGECATLACPAPHCWRSRTKTAACCSSAGRARRGRRADSARRRRRRRRRPFAFHRLGGAARAASAASASAELAAGARRALGTAPARRRNRRAGGRTRAPLGRRTTQEALGAAHDKLADEAYGAVSVLGAKALMWLIESRLAGNSGLYRWTDALLAAGDRCAPCAPGTIGRAVDARLADAALGKPMLVLIHGTASNTVGAFADPGNDATSWRALCAAFPGGIFGFEHRTFSESPVENALELLHALPDGANVSLLTHSRGGLVGDLLCLGAPSGPRRRTEAASCRRARWCHACRPRRPRACRRR